MLKALLGAACLSFAAVHATSALAQNPPPLSAYGELPGFEDAALSPSGNRLAILGIYDEQRMLLVVDKNMSLQKSMAVREMKIRGFEWVGEEMLLLRTSRTERLPFGFTTEMAEFTMGMIVPVSSDDPGEVIFTRDRNVVDRVFGYYGTRTVDGRPKAYFGGVELFRSGTGTRVGDFSFRHGRPALFEVDLAENRARKIAVAASEGFDRDWLVGANGEVVATYDIEEKTGDWRISNAQRKTLASGRQPLGRVGLVSLGQDGTTVIYSVTEGDDDDGDDETESRWFEIPLAGDREPREIFADVGIGRLYIDSTSGRLLGYLEDQDSPVPVFFDSKHQSIARAVKKAFPSLTSRLAEWSPDFSHLLVRTDGNGDSGSWYFVDVTAGSAGFIGAERPLIPPEKVGPISTVTYSAADGLDLDGILTLPPRREAKHLPVIMLPHGGPHSYDSENFDWWAQAFASRGYAVFQPNFRGSTNRDDAFVRAGYGEWGGKMQTDISDGLAHLAEQGIVDPQRACIMGASYGGYAALAGVTLQQGLYRCAVAVAPITDLKVTFNTDYRESGRNRMVHRSLLEELGPRDRFDAISPRKQAHLADAPILLIHGREDTVVPFRQSKLMADALEDAGKPFELVDLEEEDHWLTRSRTRLRMLEAAMEFVLEHNPPD